VAVPAQLANESSVTGPLGSLALSLVRPSASTMVLRAVKWHQGLERLGVVLPFVLVHDIGMIFAAPREQMEIGPRADAAVLATRIRDADRLAGSYKRLLSELLQSEAVRRAPELKMNDDLIIVVLSRLIGSVAARVNAAPAYRAALPVDAALFEGIDPQLPQLFGAVRRDFEARTLEALDAAQLFVLTMADALDLDTLRLFGMLGSEASAGAMAQVDMLAALESPEANDIVNFSLEILPSVLETKTRPAAGSTAAHGYSGIGTRGSIDSLVLTELAWDDLELMRRLMDNEVLYYAREQSKDEQKRIHYLLIDASASMRGDRQTFARGMAIATGKKLLLEGEEVAFRFFDSRLYELQRSRNGAIPTAYLLSFKGERGRNPARVFAELATDLELLRHRDARSPVIHLFTHAALYIPREMVQAVRVHAQIAGVFILPSGNKKLDLDYLDLLNAHWVVDHATLASGAARADAAKSILGDPSQKSLSDAAPASLRAGPASVRGGPASVRPGPPSQRPPAGGTT
jgi:hypothetical protein